MLTRAELKKHRAAGAASVLIENRIPISLLTDCLHYHMRSLYLHAEQHQLKLVLFFKMLFGWQTYCCQGKHRYWCWSFGCHAETLYRVRIRNVRDICFDVPPDRSAAAAVDAWKEFFEVCGDKLTEDGENRTPEAPFH